MISRLLPRQRRYILFCHSFTGCDTVSAIHGFSKEKLFERLCSGTVDNLIEVFYDEQSTVVQIQNAGIKLFQYIYRAPETSLSSQRLHRYNKQSKVGVLRPENLPPTEGSAKQHSLRAYFQLRDWIALQSMYLEANEYGWELSSRGRYEPILTTMPIAPENLLKCISCNCSGDCSTMFQR